MHIVYASDIDDIDFSTISDSADQSLRYLREIFGHVGEVLIYPGQSIIGKVFLIFNQGLFWFAIAFLTYHTSAMTVSSSQGAQKLSEKMSYFVYIRMGSGLCMIVPAISGYSFIQVIIMLVVTQGVAFGNKIWYEAVDKLDKTGALFSGFNMSKGFSDNLYLSNMLASNKHTINAMIDSTACLEVLKLNAKRVNAIDKEDILNTSNMYIGSECLGGLEATNTSKVPVCFGYQGNLKRCGAYQLTIGGKGLNPSERDLVEAVLGNLYQTAKSLAERLVTGELEAQVSSKSSDASKRDYILACGEFSDKAIIASDQCQEHLTEVGLLYGNIYLQLKDGLSQLIGSSKIPPSASLGSASGQLPWVDSAKKVGWAAAGNYYYDLARGYDGGSGADIKTQHDDQQQLLKLKLDKGQITRYVPTYQVPESSQVVGGFEEPAKSIYIKINKLFTPIGPQLFGSYAEASAKQYFNFSPSSTSGAATLSAAYDDITFELLNYFVGEVTSDGHGGHIRKKSIFDNMMVSTTAASTGSQFWRYTAYDRNKITGLFVGMADKVMSGLTGIYPANCQSSCLEHIGCLSNAISAPKVSDKCIVPGSGFLGVIAASDLLGAHMNPLFWLKNLGIMMMGESSHFFIQSSIDLIKISERWLGYYALFLLGKTMLITMLMLLPGVGDFLSALMNAFGTAFVQWGFETDAFILTLFLPFSTIIASFFYGLGLLLGAYVPLIPLILYIFAVLGWLVTVVEAMVAGPVIALGMAHPEGQDFVGKADQATMLLLSIFIRPALIVLGFLTAIILFSSIVDYIARCYIFVIYNMYLSVDIFKNAMSIIQIFVLFGCFFMFVWILLAMSVFCFGMIHILPERIIRWIGIEPDESARSAMQVLSGVKQGVSKAGSQVAQAGSATVTSLGRLPKDAFRGDIRKMDLKDLVEEEGSAAQEKDAEEDAAEGASFVPKLGDEIGGPKGQGDNL